MPRRGEQNRRPAPQLHGRAVRPGFHLAGDARFTAGGSATEPRLRRRRRADVQFPVHQLSDAERRQRPIDSQTRAGRGQSRAGKRVRGGVAGTHPWPGDDAGQARGALSGGSAGQGARFVRRFAAALSRHRETVRHSPRRPRRRTRRLPRRQLDGAAQPLVSRRTFPAGGGADAQRAGGTTRARRCSRRRPARDVRTDGHPRDADGRHPDGAAAATRCGHRKSAARCGSRLSRAVLQGRRRAHRFRSWGLAGGVMVPGMPATAAQCGIMVPARHSGKPRGSLRPDRQSAHAQVIARAQPHRLFQPQPARHPAGLGRRRIAPVCPRRGLAGNSHDAGRLRRRSRHPALQRGVVLPLAAGQSDRPAEPARCRRLSRTSAIRWLAAEVDRGARPEPRGLAWRDDAPVSAGAGRSDQRHRTASAFAFRLALTLASRAAGIGLSAICPSSCQVV
ncbi:hypothetical protein RGE_05750 [Rubrivivax gelatinosus IL144]|uniref:Uncharacterized protein n=1 Tax=Rubrivivax gelatinosus (strain NBRC 100245 / IL144) TaxID=983917 RepID=I0HLN3_RUBGI|nr:hypothetical protein RGE_05750 [Rubrivivax gelatinosus IL144]